MEGWEGVVVESLARWKYTTGYIAGVLRSIDGFFREIASPSISIKGCSLLLKVIVLERAGADEPFFALYFFFIAHLRALLMQPLAVTLW